MNSRRFFRTSSSTFLAGLLVVTILVPGVAAEGNNPTARRKAKIQRRVERCLMNKAFVYGVDFGSWPDIEKKHQEAIDESQTDDEIAAAINGALAEFEVSHLEVRTPAAMEARHEGRTIGAGFKAVPVEGGHLVTLVLEDGPAEAVGLRKGDVIFEVDGITLAGDKSDGPLLRYRLRGAPGLFRDLRWRREDEILAAKVGFGDHAVALPFSLTWREGGIAWLTLNTFRFEVYEPKKVESAFDEIRKRAQGLVIDLRSNGGGRFSNVVHLASFLVAQGQVGGISTERKDFRRRQDSLSREDLSYDEKIEALGDPFKIESDVDASHFEGPLVVLIDGASGSGGDLFPAMMQDLRSATLVGSTTAGALLGGEWCDLSGGFELVYPSQEILRPSGERVEGVGVRPDVELSPRETADDAYIEGVALRLMAELRSAEGGSAAREP